MFSIKYFSLFFSISIPWLNLNKLFKKRFILKALQLVLKYQETNLKIEEKQHAMFPIKGNISLFIFTLSQTWRLAKGGCKMKRIAKIFCHRVSGEKTSWYDYPQINKYSSKKETLLFTGNHRVYYFYFEKNFKSQVSVYGSVKLTWINILQLSIASSFFLAITTPFSNKKTCLEVLAP